MKIVKIVVSRLLFVSVVMRKISHLSIFRNIIMKVSGPPRLASNDPTATKNRSIAYWTEPLRKLSGPGI